MLRRAIWIVALLAIGYGFGQAFGPPTAAAGSVDEIVREFRLTRRAIENLGTKMDCR